MTSHVEERVRPRVRAAGWALIVLFPLVFLLGCEAVVRLLDLRPPGGPGRAMPAWLDRNIVAKEAEWVDLLEGHPGDLSGYYSTYAWDRHLFYRVRPDLEITLTDVAAPPAIRARTGWTFRTNGRGFNAREVPYDKPAGVFRIVALGDSSTFGWGVDPEDVYPHRLEALLRGRHGDRIEVVNLGVCGYTSLQGVILLEREALRYRPDVVTLSFGSNDFSLVPEPFDAALRRNLGWTGAVREVLHASRAYEYAVGLIATMRRHAAADGEDAAARVMNVGPERSAANLVAMAERVREAGSDPIYVSQCARGPLGEPIRRAAAITGAPLIDTERLLEEAASRVAAGASHAGEFARLRALYGERLLDLFPWLAVYLGDHCHPNAIGHDLVARDLLEVLERRPAFEAWRGGGAADGP